MEADVSGYTGGIGSKFFTAKSRELGFTLIPLKQRNIVLKVA